MTEATLYEIVLRGRASARFLRPLIDDFSIDHSRDGVTVLIGEIRDPSHLHGVLVHLTSVNAEIVSLAPYGAAPYGAAPYGAAPYGAAPRNPPHPDKAQS